MGRATLRLKAALNYTPANVTVSEFNKTGMFSCWQNLNTDGKKILLSKDFLSGLLRISSPGFLKVYQSLSLVLNESLSFFCSFFLLSQQIPTYEKECNSKNERMLWLHITDHEQKKPHFKLYL